MTSPRVLLTAGSIAATLAGIVPAISPSPAPTRAVTSHVSVRADGVAVVAGSLRSGVAERKRVVVPQGIAHLTGSSTGSSALAGRVRLTVVRASDGATLFTGSLHTFSALSVASGETLVVSVERPAGYAGLKAATLLGWS